MKTSGCPLQHRQTVELHAPDQRGDARSCGDHSGSGSFSSGRNNADWYRLLELCSITDSLIVDSEGACHPAPFNERLLLGLKGTMREAELHVLRIRLDGGIRN
jgi:hypothetical protein